MTVSFAVRALGVRVEVPLTQPWLTPDDITALLTMWSRALLKGPAGPADRVAVVPEAAVGRATSFPALASAVSTEVTLAAIGARAGELIMMHAAGLADADGRTVALVGPSGRGKTSVARVLGQTWGYVSDETVGCTIGDRIVAPHPKPLSIIADGTIKEQVGADGLGLQPAPPTSTLERIVLLDRDPDHAGEPEILPVPMITALSELASQLSYVDRLPTPLHTLAELIVATGGVVRLRYREAVELSGILPDLLTMAPRREAWAPALHPAAESADLRVAPTLDAITDGVREAVLVAKGAVTGPRIAIVDGIGPTVRELVARGEPRATWLDHLVAAYGEPPPGEGDRLLTAAVDDLVAAGVVVRDAA